VGNGIDTLVGSVLTLSGAGATATGITNAGFGLLDGTFEAYDVAYLVGPDLSEVRRLVQAAQGEYRQSSLDTTRKEFPTSFVGARSIIERYAGLCSFTGMRELVGKSVKDKTDALNEGVESKENRAPAIPGKPGDGSVGTGAQKPDTATSQTATIPLPPA
jgi:hypothetical protein